MDGPYFYLARLWLGRPSKRRNDLVGDIPRRHEYCTNGCE